jgi:FHA domain
MLNWKENWEKVRRYIDNEDEDKVPALIRQAQENKTESEIFLQKLLNAIAEILRSELTRIPNTNKAYIPDKFIVFLSAEAERSLPEQKRNFFEQNLSVMVYERAREMCGTLELSASKVVVKISVNGVLQADEVEVRAVSENVNRTIEWVSSHSSERPDLPPTREGTPLPPTREWTASEGKTMELPSKSNSRGTIDDDGTSEDLEGNFRILYRVEIWQSSKKLNEFPIILRTNTIGRDDEEKVANLRLPTDNRKISRLHAEVSMEDNGQVWVTALHRNPTVVSGKFIRKGEKALLGADGEIQIYDFVLKLKFTE